MERQTTRREQPGERESRRKRKHCSSNSSFRKKLKNNRWGESFRGSEIKKER